MMGRLIRQLTGHGRRAEKADAIMRDHMNESAPEKRAIKARVAAIERLVQQLEKDTTALTIGLIAVINALGYFAVIWAFRASFRELRSATWWFATGFMILAGAIILRLYWDVFMPLLRLWAPEAAAWLADHVGRYANIVFGLMKMASFFCALKCRQMLIPDEERDHWPVWKAWLHPTKIRLLPWR